MNFPRSEFRKEMSKSSALFPLLAFIATSLAFASYLIRLWDCENVKDAIADTYKFCTHVDGEEREVKLCDPNEIMKSHWCSLAAPDVFYLGFGVLFALSFLFSTFTAFFSPYRDVHDLRDSEGDFYGAGGRVRSPKMSRAGSFERCNFAGNGGAEFRSLDSHGCTICQQKFLSDEARVLHQELCERQFINEARRVCGGSGFSRNNVYGPGSNAHRFERERAGAM